MPVQRRVECARLTVLITAMAVGLGCSSGNEQEEANDFAPPVAPVGIPKGAHRARGPGAAGLNMRSGSSVAGAAASSETPQKSPPTSDDDDEPAPATPPGVAL